MWIKCWKEILEKFGRNREGNFEEATVLSGIYF